MELEARPRLDQHNQLRDLAPASASRPAAPGLARTDGFGFYGYFYALDTPGGMARD